MNAHRAAQYAQLVSLANQAAKAVEAPRAEVAACSYIVPGLELTAFVSPGRIGARACITTDVKRVVQIHADGIRDWLMSAAMFLRPSTAREDVECWLRDEATLRFREGSRAARNESALLWQIAGVLSELATDAEASVLQ